MNETAIIAIVLLLMWLVPCVFIYHRLCQIIEQLDEVIKKLGSKV